jgi:Helix-loop-helix DNA-binding domain
VSSDQFNYDFFNNAPDGSELGLGWDELPPTFMGTTSSFGQQPQPGNHGFADMNFGNMNTQMHAGPSIPPSTSADVLAAATLLQNGPHGRSMSLQDGIFREDIPRSTNGQLRHQSMAQQTPRSQAEFQQRSTTDDFMRDTFYTDMMFGPQGGTSMRHRGVSQKADIRWGSDAGFANAQGFVPPDNQENVAATERSHIKAVEEAFSLKVSHIPSSADSTEPPSPIGGPSSHQRSRSIGQKLEQEDLDSRPRKRRKSKYQEEPDDDDESPPSPTFKSGVKKRKSKKVSDDSPAPESEQASKRRKSAAAAAAKAVRENLTEEQKRENHIKSEQKRRTLIREGFEDLGELVPGLKGGGFSKSAVLIMAADWLEELIQGNEILQHRLDQLEGR